MHNQSITKWQHEHTFGQDKVKPGERGTLIVIAITATMMIVEIISGVIFGSMALLADGIHMASHTAALGISALAYLYSRKRAGDHRFSFGTGKVNALAGYSSAIILAIFSLSMIWESINRFFSPVDIAFNQAIMVAAIGLLVNVGCAWILNASQHHPHGPEHENKNQSHSHSDYNLRSAYLHVLADALTSLLALFALISGKLLGFIWMDPFMGIVGAVLVARWSLGLIKITSRVLLDHQAPQEISKKIIEAIESRDGDRVTDLHLWSIGAGIYAAAVSIVTDKPKTPDDFKNNMPENIGLVHTTIELQKCIPEKHG